MILGSDPVDGEPHVGRHVREGTLAEWTEIEEVSRLPFLDLRIEAAQTSIGAVKAGTAALSVSFESSAWVGKALFDADGPDLDAEDLKLVDRHGGTFRLAATARALPRLERVIELLVYALVVLKLESSLRDDLVCPRPTTSPRLSVPPAPDDYKGVDCTEDNSDVVFPGAYRLDDDHGDGSVGWEIPQRWRSRWSSAGAESWIQLAFSTRTFGRRKSLRRSSTRYSMTDDERPPPDSPSPSRSRSPVPPTPAQTSATRRPFGRMREKVKEIGYRLRDRSSRRSADQQHEAAAVARDVQNGGGGDGERPWDFLGGLGVFPVPHRDESVIEGPQEPPRPEQQRFEKIVQNLADFILSVSPTVLFPPPHLLFRLREQELAEPHPSRASALPSSILGTPSPSSIPRHGPPPPPFVGTEALALGFATGTTTIGNERSPSAAGPFPTASSAHIALDVKAGLASLLTNNSSLSGTFRHQSLQILVQVARKNNLATLPCREPCWITIPFFRSTVSPHHDTPTLANDLAIASFIEQLVHEREAACATCGHQLGEHVVVLLHQRERVEVALAHHGPDGSSALSGRPENVVGDAPAPVPDGISTRTTCSTCGASTRSAPLTPAAGAFSLAKFVELILYDTCFVPSPDLCEHAGVDRCALVRSFALGETAVEFKVGTINLFELRLPTAVDPDLEATDGAVDLLDSDPVNELAQEITSFFTSVEAHLDLLESRLDPPSSSTSSSCADAVGLDDVVEADHERDEPDKVLDGAREGAAREVRALLDRLRSIAHGVEEVCMWAAQESVPSRLNGARSVFEREARAFKVRLAAWEVKHVAVLGPREDVESTTSASFTEPSYFESAVDVVPVGSSVLVRDGELSSVIALALSATPFQGIVGSTSTTVLRGGTAPGPAVGVASRASSRAPSSRHKPIPAEFLPLPPSFPSSTPSTPFISPSSTPLRQSVTVRLDPDDADAVFGPPANLEYVAKWRKAPRVGGNSLFRSLGRKRSGASVSPSPSLPADSSPSSPTPLSSTILDDLLATPNAPVAQHKHVHPTPSIISGLAAKRDAVTTAPVCAIEATSAPSERASGFTDTAAGTIRSLTASCLSTPATRSRASSTSISLEGEAAPTAEGSERPAVTPSVARPAPLSGSRILSAPLEGLYSGWSTARATLGRLSPGSASSAVIDTVEEGSDPPSEHVKLKIRHGEKTYRVTSFYEKRFRALRARCGVSESLFIESLARCSDLDPSGGKSGAAFLMTHDERFILKELSARLGYSELDALLDFAPKLLDYLMNPERPSLLAKIFGIYTVKIVDSKTNKRVKVDLILMEHLFYSRNISRQFDLKGIASRVAKPRSGPALDTGTGWDGDWLTDSLEGQLYIYPHSKALLRDALANDVRFLSDNGGIDFSLLVGVDDTHQELVVGLIDTLGVFNTLKTLEHHTKAAMRLATASDPSSVTVQPPADYARRFLSAMERYFVAVPDKWTRPPGGAAVDADPRLACPL
ncbi:hypothetical protein JCM8208_006266 [Rhodotorula glutinis]